jgi:hypothetical protein
VARAWSAALRTSAWFSSFVAAKATPAAPPPNAATINVRRFIAVSSCDQSRHSKTGSDQLALTIGGVFAPMRLQKHIALVGPQKGDPNSEDRGPPNS